MAGERLTRPETAGGLDGGAADPRLEVGERPDGRAPPVSDRPQKEEGGRAGPAEQRLGHLGRPTHAGEETGRRPG
jgi:hypothetical protein